MICIKCQEKPAARGVKSIACLKCKENELVPVNYIPICNDCSSSLLVCNCCGYDLEYQKYNNSFTPASVSSSSLPITINTTCYYYECGGNIPEELGAHCNKKKINILEAECINCDLVDKTLFFNYKIFRSNRQPREDIYNLLNGENVQIITETDGDNKFIKKTTMFAVKLCSDIYLLDVVTE